MGMKRVVLLILSAVVVLSSCSPIHVGRVLTDNSNLRADEKAEKLINAINNRDNEAIKALFSKKTVNDVADFDESIERLYEFIQDEIVSWESTGSYGGETSNSNGHKTEEKSSYYYVNTNNQRYYFLLDDCLIDTYNPDNVGYYLFIVTKAENREKVFNKEQKIFYDGDIELTPTGILIPFE